MKLFLTEITRFWSRRIVQVSVLVLMLLMLIGTGIGFIRTSSEISSKQEAIEQCIRYSSPGAGSRYNYEEEYYEEEVYEEDSSLTEEEQKELEKVIAEQCQESNYRDYQEDNRFWAIEILSSKWDYQENNEDQTVGEVDDNSYYLTTLDGERLTEPTYGFSGVIPSLSIPILVLIVLLGASVIGAEYRTGTLENLLLWEPRRWKVILTKYAAGALSSALLMTLLLGFLTALLTLLASVHGTFEGVDGAFWGSLLGVIGRSALLAALACMFSMAIATVTRYTAAAVVVLLGWAVTSNILIETLLHGFRRWELINNANSFVTKGDTRGLLTSWCTVDNGQKFCQINPGYSQEYVAHGYLTAGLVVAFWAIIPMVIALLVFRRRDID